MTPILPRTVPRKNPLGPTRGMQRSEAEMIAGRIESARHWRRRRAYLRLRAALFGRRKLARRGRPAHRQAALCPEPCARPAPG